MPLTNEVANLARLVLALVGELLLYGLPRVLGLSLVFLVGALVAVVVVGWRGAFKRSVGWWNVLAKLAYVWVPLVLMACGGALGMLWGAHALVDEKVRDALAPLVRKELPHARDWVVKHVDWEPGHQYSVDEASDRVVKALHVDSEGGVRGRLVNAVTQRFGRVIINVALRVLLWAAARGAGGALDLDDQTVQFSVGVLAEMDLTRLDDGFMKVFEDALKKQLAKVFHVLYFKVGLLTALALAIPGVEAGVYFLWFVKRPKAAAPVPATPAVP